MSDSQSHEKSVLDCVFSPFTLMPLGLGLTLFIVAWVVSSGRVYVIFAGVMLVLASMGIAVTQVLWSSLGGGGDPKAEAEFFEDFDRICGSEQYDPAQEAERSGTPATMERA